MIRKNCPMPAFLSVHYLQECKTSQSHLLCRHMLTMNSGLTRYSFGSCSVVSPLYTTWRNSARNTIFPLTHISYSLICFQDCQTSDSNRLHRIALVFGKNQPGISQLNIDPICALFGRGIQNHEVVLSNRCGVEWLLPRKEPLHDCNFIFQSFSAEADCRPIFAHQISPQKKAPQCR